MKLADICAKEFTEWPELSGGDFKVKWLVQSANGEIASWEDDGDLIFADGRWDIFRSCPVDYHGQYELAEDHSTVKVTYDQWLASVASRGGDAREATLTELVTLIENADSNGKTIAEAIYDAGYRKP